MASMSQASPLRRQSSKLTLHLRAVSTPCPYNTRNYSLSQFSRFYQTWTSASTQSAPLWPFQARSFATKLAHKFKPKASNAKPSAAQAAISSRKQHQQQPPAPAAGTGTASSLPLTNLPYFIRRTPSNQFPVYLETKAGGTRQLTKVQKTEGDMDALRQDLIHALGMEKTPENVQINRLNGHIIVKGWRKQEILDFLAERKF